MLEEIKYDKIFVFLDFFFIIEYRSKNFSVLGVKNFFFSKNIKLIKFKGVFFVCL